MTTSTLPPRAEVRIERHFDAPPSAVFQAWTEPELVKRWVWASLAKDPWAECDARVGGTYRIYSNIPGGKHEGEGWSGMCGVFVEIVPDRKLVYTIHWDADVGYNSADRLTLDEVVSVTLEPDGAGTRMTLVHMGFPDEGDSAKMHKAGTEESLDMLAGVLAE